MKKLKTFTNEVLNSSNINEILNNQLFDFYKVQIIELVEKFKQLEWDDDQKFASVVLADTIEICNEWFGWNLTKVKSCNE